MFVSFFMIDPVTMEYLPNEIVFKITMILLSAIVTFLFFRKIKNRGILQVQVPLIHFVCEYCIGCTNFSRRPWYANY